jgi:Mn-dependent DtxR family transcriptional regulator
LLRVETTINKPELPGLKLKKPACNLQAYYWYGHACNSRYLTTLSDIDISSLGTEDFEKYQRPVINEKGRRIAAPDLRKEEQLELYSLLLSANYFANGFRNRDLRELLGNKWKTAKIAYELRKLRERGAIKKIKSSHYYRLTQEGVNWLFYSLFNLLHFVSPLLSKQSKVKQNEMSTNPSVLEQAYSNIEKQRILIMSELGIAA